MSDRPEVKRVKAGDLTVSYAETGSGPPLLLLHGGLANAEMSWAAQYDRLAAHFHVYAPDTRGHGSTDNPTGRLSYDQFADDVVAFCAALNIEYPLIVGYSDGGQTAIELSLRQPGLARAMVLGGTVSFRSADYEAGIRDWGFPAPGVADYDKIKSGYGAYFDTIEQAHRGDGQPDYLRRMLEQISTLWLTLPNYSLKQLQSITAPVLIIAGDRDHMVDLEQLKRLRENIPSSELAIVPNADHGASELELFWVLVMDFLKRHSIE